MAYALATRLERAVKKSGVKYKAVSGWRNRGHGTMGSISSIMCHHTAGGRSGNSPSLNVVAYGRPGLSGPLSQLFLARDGTVYLVAAGLSYHAGRVISSAYQNSRSIGIEAENTGLSNDQPWPERQMDAYAKLCKALRDEFNLPTSRIVGHKEAAPSRKIDPTFNMAAFRKRVAGASTTPTPAPKPAPPKGLFGMSMQKSMTRNKDIKLPARKWKTVPVDDKGNTSIISGLKPGDGALINAHFDLNGVPKGANVQVRFYTVSYKKGTKTRRLWSHYMTEFVGTDGITYALVPFLRRNTTKAGAGRSIRIRCEIRVFQKGITLRRAQFNRAKG